MQHRSRADTNHDIMRFVVGSLKEMDVIDPNERKVQPFRQDLELCIDQVLGFEPVIMQFKKEMIFAENIGKFRSGSFGFFEIAVLNRDINFTFQTGAHPNQSGAMLG